MADVSSDLNVDDYQWTKATSNHGVPYENGVKKVDPVTDGDIDASEHSRASLAPAGPVTVNWTVGSGGATSSAVQQLGIRLYNLTRATIPVPYEFVLLVFVSCPSFGGAIH